MSATGHPTVILDDVDDHAWYDDGPLSTQLLDELEELDQNTYEIATPAVACNALRAGTDQSGDRA